MDLIFASCAIPILSWVSARRAKKQIPKSDFFEDSPVERSEDDLLDYKGYAQLIADKLNASIFSKSFAIGVTGPWGSGKTTFMKFVKNRLHNDRRIILEFNPWSGHGTSSIVIDFFQAMNSALKRHHQSVGSTITDYARSLVESYGNSFFKKISPFNADESWKERFDEMDRLLARIGMQIVIFIDDLDRLDSSELLDVIKLIRNTGSFHNVVFIAAYDRNYLITAIDSMNSYRSELFLEKIFQMEVSLPHFERKILQDDLFNRLKKRIDTIYHKEIEGLIRVRRFGEGDILNKYIENIRDNVRFANLFCLSFEKLQGETVLEELFFLELLRFKYPAVYWLLHKNRTFFLDVDDKGYYKVKDGLGGLLKTDSSLSISIDESYLGRLSDLVKKIFPRTALPMRSDYRSVIYPSSFDRYFAIRLFEGDLSEIKFSANRLGDQQTFNQYIQDMIESGLDQPLIRRLERIEDFDNREDYEKVLRGVFFCARAIVKKKRYVNDIISIPSDIVRKTANAERIASRFYGGSTLQASEFAMSNFANAEYPYLTEGYMAGSIIEELWGENFELFTVSALENEILRYFKEVLTVEEAVNEVVLDAYDNCWVQSKQKRRSGTGRDGYLLQGADQLFRDFLTNRPIAGFLNYIIIQNHKTMLNNRYRLSPEVIDIFGSWESFDNFVKQLDEVDDTNREFKDFFNLAKASGLDEHTEFQFVYLRRE